MPAASEAAAPNLLDRKKCASCGDTKDLLDFYVRTRAKDGRDRICKVCDYAKRNAHYLANIEREKARFRAYYLKNREHIRLAQKDWHKRNPDLYHAAAKRHRQKYPEKVTEKAARRRARIRGVECETVDRLEVYERDGGVCHICGGVVPKTEFELDHVVPLYLGGPHKAYNLRVAHRPCNRAKGVRLLDPQISFAV